MESADNDCFKVDVEFHCKKNKNYKHPNKREVRHSITKKDIMKVNVQSQTL